MPARLEVTDGDTTVDLIDTGGNIIRCIEWQPAISQPKAGGIYQESALADGRRLVLRRRENVAETFDLTVGEQDADFDMVALELSRLRALLDKGVDYWNTDWENTPVYIVAQAEYETNPRYAIIYNWSTPNDSNPFSQPALQPYRGTVFTNWMLTIERGHWLALPPGDAECVLTSARASASAAFTQDAPTASSDDCWVTSDAQDDISLSSANLIMGNTESGLFSSGIRFRSVDVPAGAIIEKAFIRLVGSASLIATEYPPPTMLIAAERDTTPAVFSTNDDFWSRYNSDGSQNKVSWRIAGVIEGVAFDTPDLTDVIQEIVDLGTWSSGNDLVIFFVSHIVTDDAWRQFASYDHQIYNPPELHIAYRGVLYGQEETCEQTCYVASKRNVAQLTHIYTYDGVYSGNLLDADLPYALMQGVPQSGDLLFFGIDTTTTNSGPFSSLVFDLSTAGAGYTAVWEYYDGGSWSTLDVRDNTDNALPLNTPGVNSVHWIPPSDWATIAVNGTTGYWVRLRLTGNGTAAPVQQNRDIYTITWPHVETSDVSGDLPALMEVRIANQSFDLADPTTRLPIDRAICGLRSLDRGSSFTAYLNLSDEQNPTGISVGVDATDSAFANDADAPSGRRVTYSPGATRSLAGEVRITIGDQIIQQYYGTYHAYLRVQQTAASAGDVSLQLNITPGASLASSSDYWESEIKYTYDTDEINLIDFGELTIFPGKIPQGAILGDVTISILIGNTNSASVLRLYDLILIPVDEWATDTKRRSASDTLSTEYTLELDAISAPKDAPLAILREDASGNAVATYKALNNELPLLQANAEQRLWFLFEEDTVGTLRSQFHTAAAIQLLKVDRFLSFRGAR